MTNRDIHPEPEHGLPPDIADLAASLDRLGASDAREASALEARIMHASTAHLKGLSDVISRADALAGTERASAPIGLEDRIVAASMSALGVAKPKSEVHLHLAGEGRITPVTRRRSWAASGKIRAIAAVLFFGVGGLLVWQAITPQTTVTTTSNHVTTEELAAKFDDDLNVLYAAMSDLNVVSEGDSTSGSIDELLEEGAS